MEEQRYKEYKESPKTREIKSEIAGQKPRDEEGHFVRQTQAAKPSFFSSLFGASPFPKTASEDTLIDVHVNNPLKRIIDLLTDIKRQKAFSFTLKGSLGIAGVALVLGVFGVFGGGQILCERGIQSQIGIVKILNVTEEDPSAPLISDFLNLISSPKTHNRIVLIKNDQTVIGLFGNSLINNNSSLVTTYSNYPIIATGNYNSCSQTLTVAGPASIELLGK